MGAGNRIAIKILLFSQIIVAVAACKQQEPEAKSTAATSRTEDTRKRLKLIADTRDELDDWFKFYNLNEEADTLFRLREVWDTALLAFPVSEDWQKLYDEHDELFEPAPDKAKVLDIYTYDRQFTTKRRGKVKAAAVSADGEVAIVNTERGEKVRLMFCGGVCQFHAGWWRNPDEVVVVGLIRGFDNKTLYPTLWQINTYTQQVKQYTSLAPAQPKKDKNYLQQKVLDEL